MSNQPESNETQDTPEPTTDQARRKFASAGVVGTGVPLSVASRSAMGGWGQCTGSELASGNLSRTGDANPCGCSPGYWWNDNGDRSWDMYLASKYPKTSQFNEVFGVNYFVNSPPVLIGDEVQLRDSSTTLSGCNEGNSSKNGKSIDNSTNNIAWHAVAALLNAEFYGNRYPTGLHSGSAVIAEFQSAFSTAGSDKCARLKAFVARVNVYTAASTWCFGKKH